MFIFPDLPDKISLVLLPAAFLVPPLYLLLVEGRDGQRPRLYRIVVAAISTVILLAMGLIVLLMSTAGPGFAGIPAAMASTMVAGFVVLPVSIIVWAFFAVSLARKITQKPQVESTLTPHVRPQTWLVGVLFIFLILTTVYFGWQSRGRNFFKFDPTQIFRGLLAFPPSLTSDGAKLPEKGPGQTPAQPLSLYTNQKFNFAFSYPESLNLYHVNEEKEDDNLLRIFFESKEKGEIPSQYNQRNSTEQLFQSFLSTVPGFGGYFNRETRPVIYSLIFYVKSKSHSQSLFDVSQKVRAEFCKEESFTLSDLKVGEKTGLKIVCDRYNLYLLTDPYQARQYFVLGSRLSALTPEDSQAQRSAELEQVSQTILDSLTVLEGTASWKNYQNETGGYGYKHPRTWKNDEICPQPAVSQFETSPSASATASAAIQEKVCPLIALSRILSPGYFAQDDKALFMVETGGPSCPVIKNQTAQIFLDGRSADVAEENGEKIISLKANNLCYQITLQARPNSPLRPVLEQILSTLKFKDYGTNIHKLD